MTPRTKTALSSMIRPLVEARLPDWVEPLWFASQDEALEIATQAEIGWFDFNQKEPMVETVKAATGLKWLNSIYAGLEFLPLDLLKERGTIVTNGAGRDRNSRCSNRATARCHRCSARCCRCPAPRRAAGDSRAATRGRCIAADTRRRSDSARR